MNIEYRFNFSEEHLLTARLRRRQLISWLHRFDWFKRILVIPAALLLGFCIMRGLVVPSAILAWALAGMLMSWPLNAWDTWLIRRRFRKSPYYGDEIVFAITENGTHAVGRNSEVRIGWASFTKARRFRDGTILFQGPNVYNWLPDKALVDQSAISAFLDLISKHIKDYRTV